jgi:hypothetical protein
MKRKPRPNLPTTEGKAPTPPPMANTLPETPQEEKAIPKWAVYLCMFIVMVIICFLTDVWLVGLAAPLGGYILYIALYQIDRDMRTESALGGKKRKENLHVTCSCGQAIPITAGQAGTQIRCPSCQQSVEVPSYSHLRRRS